MPARDRPVPRTLSRLRENHHKTGTAVAVPLVYLSVSPAGQRNENTAEEVAHPGRPAEFTLQPVRRVTEQRGICFFGLRRGIPDQRYAFAHRTQRRGEPSGTVHPAAESHGGFTGFADKVFRAEQVCDLLCPDVETA